MPQSAKHLPKIACAACRPASKSTYNRPLVVDAVGFRPKYQAWEPSPSPRRTGGAYSDRLKSVVLDFDPKQHSQYV